MKSMTVIGWALCTAASMTAVHAGRPPAKRPASQLSISPLYSQLVAFAMPANFRVVFEKDSGPEYIREAVPAGETVNRWSQMITVTAAKGRAADPQVSPRGFVQAIAGGFENACPQSFAATVMSEGQLETGQTAFTALVDCGSVGVGAQKHRETALITAIQGASDVYTLQWAERSKAVEGPPKADMARWNARLKALLPIRVCDRVPDETAPYPSCLPSR